MKRVSLLLALSAAASAFACNPAGGPADDADPAPDFTVVTSPDDPNMGTATLRQFLVDIDDAPDCAEVRSGCLDDRNYAYCVWQVEGDVGETMLINGGSCNSGYVCEEYRVGGMDAARCVDEDDTSPSGDRSIECLATGSDDHLRCTIEGDLMGGLVSRPTRPYRVLYGGDPIDGESGDTWRVPYPSGSIRDYASYSTSRPEGPWVIDLEPDVENFNFYLSDSQSSSRGSWIDLLNGDWDVGGDAEIDDDRLVRSDGSGGGGGGGSGGAGSITCSRSGSYINVTIRGPIQEHLIDGTVSSPSRILYGSGSTWSVSAMRSSGRASANWTSDTSSYTLRLPQSDDGFNFFLLGSGSTGRWFDLNTSGKEWTFNGCRLSSTLLYVR